MKQKMPSTPFSTRLSGSAKETELRLRSIFQWKKKRPPVVLLLLIAALLLGICGGLVAFRTTPRSGPVAQVYPEYFAENSTDYIEYSDKNDYPYLRLEQGSENFAAAMEYLGGTELRAVLGHKKYIGDFNYRNGAFFVVGEHEEPLKIELYPDGYIVISTGWGQTEDHKDAKVYRAKAFDKETFMGYWGTGDSQPQHQPTQAVYDLFGEDGITLTLYLANEGGQNAYTVTNSYAERFAVLMSGYEWNQLETPLTEPSEFHLTAKSLDGERTMTFWSGSTVMIQYNGSDTTAYWQGKPVSPEAISIAEDIRRIYNLHDVNYSRVMFHAEGTAQDAANSFVHSEYEKHLTSLAPGSPYAVSEYAVVKWLVREVSADGLAVTGDFEYAFVPVVPDAVEIWAGNTSEGTGEYEGMLTAYRQFTLQKQEDGYWHCIDLGTGGSQLHESSQSEEPDTRQENDDPKPVTVQVPEFFGFPADGISYRITDGTTGKQVELTAMADVEKMNSLLSALSVQREDDKITTGYLYAIRVVDQDGSLSDGVTINKGRIQMGGSAAYYVDGTEELIAYLHGLYEADASDTQAVLDYVDEAFSNERVNLFCWLLPGTGPVGVSAKDCYEQVRQVFARFDWTREEWGVAQPELGPEDWYLWLESDYGPNFATTTNDNLVTLSTEQVCYRYDGEPGELIEKLVALWDGPGLRYAMFYWPDQIDDDQMLAETYVEWFKEFYLSSGAIEEIRWHETTIENPDDVNLRILIRYSVKPVDLANSAWKNYAVSEDGWVDLSVSIALEKTAPHQVSSYQTP